MKRRLKIRTVLTLLAALGALGGPATAADAPKRGGTLRVGMQRDITLLNPLVGTRSTDKSVRTLLYDSLLTLDRKGNIEPNIAESWNVSSDGLTVTFKIRKGVKFHNGKDVTAEDVKFSMDYTLNPKNGAYGFSALRIARDVEAPDRYTLRVHLRSVSAGFLSLLTDIQSFAVVPSQSIEEGVRRPTGFPPGTGPFKFVEWKARQRMVLERFEDFWGHKAFVDQLVLQPVDNETVRLTALQAGDLDMIERAPLEWVKEIKAGKVKGTRYAEATEASWRRLKFNASGPPFNNVLLRQAVAHAIDKKEILSAAFFGFGEPGDQKYPAGHRWYAEGVEQLSYDLNKARELVKKAGYGGQPMSVVVEQSQMRETESAVVQAQLKKIGLNVKLELMDRAALVSLVEKGEFGFYITGGDNKADPASTYTIDFLCPENPQRRTFTNPGYCDKEMDKLLAALETELNGEKRKRILREIVQKLAQEVPEIPIGSVPRHFAFRDYVKGFSLSGDDLLRWSAGGLNHTWLGR